jgi:hypothetical protein
MYKLWHLSSNTYFLSFSLFSSLLSFSFFSFSSFLAFFWRWKKTWQSSQKLEHPISLVSNGRKLLGQRPFAHVCILAHFRGKLLCLFKRDAGGAGSSLGSAPGWAVAGWAVAGWAVAGWAVASWAAAGWAVAGVGVGGGINISSTSESLLITYSEMKYSFKFFCYK